MLNACENVLFFFDENCALSEAMANQTEKGHERIYEGLKKGGLISPDDLTAHENDIRSIAFTTDYFCGTGHFITGTPKAKYALHVLKSAWNKAVHWPPALKE